VDSQQAYQHTAILQHSDLFIAIVTMVSIQMFKQTSNISPTPG